MKTGGLRTGKATLVAAATGFVAILHFATPAGPGGVLGLHLLYQKLFYITVPMAAAWFGVRGTMTTAVGVTGLLLVHLLWNWAGDPVRQAEQLGEIASVWVRPFPRAGSSARQHSSGGS